MRDVDRSRPDAKFGRVDPFCWILVVPMLLLAIMLIIDIDRVVGVLIAVMAVLIAVFDSWLNRPSAQPPPAPKRR